MNNEGDERVKFTKLTTSSEVGRFNVESFIEGLDSTSNEIETRELYMDYHLKLLHEAILTGNEVVAEFQRSQLSKIRDRLEELGYFPVQAVLV